MSSICRLVILDRSFAAACPRLWNSLPVDVQSAPSLTLFLQKLKSHLFRQSYPAWYSDDGTGSCTNPYIAAEFTCNKQANYVGYWLTLL